MKRIKRIIRNVAILSINLPLSAYICYSFLRISFGYSAALMKDGHWEEEISVASVSSGTVLFEKCDRGSEKKREDERNKKRESKSGRVWFLSASRYQAEGGHMKLANVPTCPFPTYRVFPAPCSRVESEKRKEGRGGLKAMGDKGKSRPWKAKVGGGSREGGGNVRRGFLLISRTWLKLVRHKNQVSSLPGIRYRFRSFLFFSFPPFFAISSLHLFSGASRKISSERNRPAWISVYNRSRSEFKSDTNLARVISPRY